MALSVCGGKVSPQEKEIIQHGTTLFPIACYENDLSKNAVPWHWHDEFESIVVISGSLEVNLEKARLLLHQGEGIFINSKVVHAVESSSKCPALIHSIVFHPRLIGGSMDSIFWQKLIQPLLQDTAFRYFLLQHSSAWQDEMLNCINTAWNAAVAETDDYENLIRYQLSIALRLLNQHCPVIMQKLSGQEQITAERIKNMLSFIEEHYTEELTVERIAESVSVSGSVCLRCFRQILGTTPIQYVKQFRIEKAAKLLLTTNMKVKEVGMECGFSDISYFTKTFREIKGCTPKEYQNL